MSDCNVALHCAKLLLMMSWLKQVILTPLAMAGQAPKHVLVPSSCCLRFLTSSIYVRPAA
jgi:hypothetical protein